LAFVAVAVAAVLLVAELIAAVLAVVDTALAVAAAVVAVLAVVDTDLGGVDGGFEIDSAAAAVAVAVVAAATSESDIEAVSVADDVLFVVVAAVAAAAAEVGFAFAADLEAAFVALEAAFVGFPVTDSDDLDAGGDVAVVVTPAVEVGFVHSELLAVVPEGYADTAVEAVVVVVVVNHSALSGRTVVDDVDAVVVVVRMELLRCSFRRMQQCHYLFGTIPQKEED
jgi:hypothetical protein